VDTTVLERRDAKTILNKLKDRDEGGGKVGDIVDLCEGDGGRTDFNGAAADTGSVRQASQALHRDVARTNEATEDRGITCDMVGCAAVNNASRPAISEAGDGGERIEFGARGLPTGQLGRRIACAG
jgi:hypothetical protein